MTKEKIIEKLCSRKLWLAVAELVAMLIVFFGGAEEVATQVVALIMAGASVIAYIIGEGLVDAADETTGDGTTYEDYEGATVNNYQIKEDKDGD